MSITFNPQDMHRAIRALKAVVANRDCPAVTIRRVSAEAITVTMGTRHDTLATYQIEANAAAFPAFSVNATWLTSTLRRFAPGRNQTATLQGSATSVTLMANGWQATNPIGRDKWGTPEPGDPVHEDIVTIPKGRPYVIMQQKGAVRAAKHVGAGASNDDNLPILQHLGCQFEDGRLTMVGTDRYRLHRARLSVVIDGDVPEQFMLKAPLFKAITPHANEAAVIIFDGERLFFDAGALEVEHLAYNGDFPKVGSLFEPQATNAATRHADVDTPLLRATTKTLAALMPRHAHALVTVDDGMLTMKDGARLDDQGVEAPAIPAPSEGHDEPHTAGFNPHYLAEITAGFKESTTRIHLPENTVKPAYFQELNSPIHADAIIMPVRITNPLEG